MKPYDFILAIILLLALTSCNMLILDSKIPKESTALVTPTYETTSIPETATAQYQELQKSQTPVLTQPSDPTLTKVTPMATDEAIDSAKPPTLTPTNQILLKPTATQALLSAQIGSPIGISNFAHPDLGCGWMGLAGQIFDIDDKPIDDLVVEVGGSLNNQPIFGLAITGQVDAYGPGGYEIKLGDDPIDSTGSLWAQVFDLDGNSISSQIYFPTFDDCDQNLILLNFVQSYKLPSAWFYLPVLYNNTSNQ